MPTSEEDLQAQRERNEELRQAIADEKNKRLETQQSLSSDITAQQLVDEEARLQAELMEVQADNERLANIRPKSLAEAQAEMEATLAAQQKAQEEAAAAEAQAAEEAAAAAQAEQEAAAAAAAEAEAAAAEKKKEGGN